MFDENKKNDTFEPEAEPTAAEPDAEPIPAEPEVAQEPVVAEPLDTAAPQTVAYQAVTSYTYQNTQNGYQSSYSDNKAPAPSQPYSYTLPQPPKKPEPPKSKPRFSVMTLIACIIITALISVTTSAIVTALMVNTDNSTSSSTTPNYSNADITITDNSTNFVEAVAAKVKPSVVGVVSRYTYNSNNFFENNSQDVESEGSGVIYSSDGYIITNKHVVDYAISYNGSVEVYLPEQPDKPISAKVVGYDAAYDLAVLKIERTGLKAISIGESAALAIGEQVVAVGNPGGLEFMGSVSVGYVSGLSRTVVIDTFAMEVLQTDAAINPGNSGGALVDSEGKLIGITSSKIVSEDFEGMGFAIPVDTVVEVCKNLITNSNEPTPYIGVQIATNYTTSYLESMGYPGGVVVAAVVEDGPADIAGVRQYDIITFADGVEIDSYNKLINVIHKHKIGEPMKITVYRSGRSIELSVTPVASNG